MKHILLATALLALLPAGVWSQTRDIRGERLVVDDGNNHLITLKAPGTGMTGNWTFTLPAAAPSAAGQALTSDGSGGFSWQTPSGGGGGSIPAGFMIIGTTNSAPSGYTAAGTIVQQGTNVWVPRAPALTIRSSAVVAAAGGKIYVIGGNFSGAGLTTNEEYDPATNTWTTKAAMTTARESMAAASVGGKIYVFGGKSTTGPTILTTNEEYDPVANTWATKTAMTTARRDLTATVVAGKIYVIGGRTNATGASVHTAVNEEYNPATNTWTAKTAMPVALREMGTAETGGKIYIFGGSSDDGMVSDTREYNPTTNAWTSKTPLPQAQNSLAATTLSSLIYAVGPDGVHYRYDPTANSWEILTPAPSTFIPFANGYVTVGSQLYAFGSSEASYQYVPPTTLYLYSKN